MAILSLLLSLASLLVSIYAVYILRRKSFKFVSFGAERGVAGLLNPQITLSNLGLTSFLVFGIEVQSHLSIYRANFPYPSSRPITFSSASTITVDLESMRSGACSSFFATMDKVIIYLGENNTLPVIVPVRMSKKTIDFLQGKVLENTSAPV